MDEETKKHYESGKEAYEKNDFKKAIKEFMLALKGVSREDDPEMFAKINNCLGLSFDELPTGNRTDNLKKAIACYESALQIFTKKKFPDEYAMAQKNLGEAYRLLPTGDRADNLKKAIACYESALKIFTKKKFPAKYAMAQNNLGIAYSDLPTGDKAENQNKAIACYESALEIFTKKNFPADYAMTQNNLGAAYLDLPTGDRADNLKKAIACIEAALEIRTKEEHPDKYAMTQNNHGVAYFELPYGDRADNLKKAIAYYKAALEIRTKAERQDQYAIAMTQNNLGAAYYELPTEDRADNLKKAIAYFEAALEIRTKKKYPAAYAMTQNNLGAAYSDLPTGDRADNLKKAVECYEAALEIRTKKDFPEKYAMTQNNLGNVYSDSELSDGSEIANLKKAEKAYLEAAEGYKLVGLYEKEKAILEKAEATKYRYELKHEKGEEARRNEETAGMIMRLRESFEKNAPGRGDKSLFDVMGEYKDKMEGFLTEKSRNDKSEDTLTVLRRYNSYTPILPHEGDHARGGGYFLQCGGTGVVIDPGFNFLQNFFEAGFHAVDIDYVCITHAHNDHTVDLESLVTLLYEHKGRAKSKGKEDSIKKIKLVMNRNANIKYAVWIDLSRDVLKETIIISEKMEEIDLGGGLKLKAVKAYHKDIVAESGAVGFVFKWKGRTMFFTGDSACPDEYIIKCKEIGKIDLFIPHLGEVARQEMQMVDDGKGGKKFGKPLDNHLGMLGVVKLMQNLEPELTLISEFGEEMCDVREEVADKLTRVLKRNTLSADVELNVRITDNKIKCYVCDKFAPFSSIRTGSHENNLLRYYCKKHKPAEVERAIKEKREKRRGGL